MSSDRIAISPAARARIPSDAVASPQGTQCLAQWDLLLLLRGAPDAACGDAAIDDQLGSGDIARGIRGEEQDAVGDLLGLAGTPERRADLRQFVGAHRLI